jgi:hypothetical protein
VSISKIELCGEPDAVHTYLGSAADVTLEGLDVAWVDAEETGLVAVWFQTPHGEIRID